MRSICSIDGCSDFVAGRGWCMAHYNRWHYHGDPLGGAEEVLACLVCSAPTPPKPARGPRPKYCSPACRASAYKPHTAQRAKELRAERRASRPLRTCVQCGVQFDGLSSRKFCTDSCSRASRRANNTRFCSEPDCTRPLRAKGLCNTCYKKARGEKTTWNDRRRDNDQRRRALKSGASTGRPVLLSEIRERDGNVCHLCRKKVSAKPYPHPLSASIDHIVPLTRGGAHDPSNASLAHLACNVQKGNRGGNEQLLLIG